MGERSRRRRSSEREATIAARRAERDRQRLARLAEGGSPERPLVVESPAEIEVVAGAMPCPLCGASQRVLDHAARVIEGARMRIVRTACASCRSEHSVYFALRPIPIH